MSLEYGRYFRDIKWAPDGSCILALTDYNYQIYNFQNLHNGESSSSKSTMISLAPDLQIKESTRNIYDFDWFPGTNSQQPATCCFISSAKSQPIKLYDAYWGSLRATYSAYDDKDCLSAPHSIRFLGADGRRIIGGFENCFRVFDVDRPGRDFYELKTTKCRRSRDGLKGVISTVDCVNLTSDHDDSLVICGTFTGNLGAFDLRSGQFVWMCRGIGCSVSQVKSFNDGTCRLAVAGRQNDSVSIYDMRTSDVLYEFPRSGRTNQRLFFDLWGNEIVCGDLNGQISLHNAETLKSETLKVAHEDPVTAARFNPVNSSIIASCSGQRQFHCFSADSDSDSESEQVLYRKFESTLRIQKIVRN